MQTLEYYNYWDDSRPRRRFQKSSEENEENEAVSEDDLQGSIVFLVPQMACMVEILCLRQRGIGEVWIVSPKRIEEEPGPSHNAP